MFYLTLNINELGNTNCVLVKAQFNLQIKGKEKGVFQIKKNSDCLPACFA